jgi:hypothetical protein
MRLGRCRFPAFALAAALFVAHAPAFAAGPPMGPEQWTLIDPGVAPRHDHTVTYDPVGNRMILFGGSIYVLSNNTELNDLWELSLSGDLTWRPLIATGTPPPPRRGHVAVYDAANHRIIIHGGSQGPAQEEQGDVWILNLNGTPSWTHLMPGGADVGWTHDHVAIYDPVGQRMIVNGGLGVYPGGSSGLRILSFAGTPTWSVVEPTGGINVRRGATATYDATGQRMIVIGGGSGSNSSPVAVALSLNGPLQWSQLAPNGDREDLNGHAAVYNPDDHSILVFAGYESTSGLHDELWRLSLGATPAWTQLNPAASPRERIDHAAIYDPVGHRMVVFGGLDNVRYQETEDSHELWTYSPGANAWTEILALGSQPERGLRATMSADPVGQRMIVTGGNVYDRIYSNQAHGKSTTGEELWHPFGATGSPPSGRAGHSTIVDVANERLVLFGGQTEGGTNIYPVYSNEVWVASVGPNPVWALLTPAGIPPAPRSDHSAIYDPVNQRMIVFGGVDNGGSKSECWELSLGANPTWTQLVSNGFVASPRHAHTAVYDAHRQRMIVYAGASGGGTFTLPAPLGDMRAFALDGSNTWSIIAPPGSDPSDRYGHAAVYDPVGHRMIVFGGQGSTGMRQDAWSLPLWKSGASWKQLQPLGTIPGERSFPAYGYDAGSGRVYVFGGGTPVEDRARFDTWTLTLNSCPPPFITSQPVAATQPFGTTVTFSVTATGAVGYRWQKSGVPLSDGGRISGALTSSLSIAGFQASDVASYRVQVFGACDTVFSDAVPLAEGCNALGANPPAHMVAWWAMDPGVGNGVPDVLNTKSNKNHASRTGNATLVPAIIGTAVRCDGLEDGLHVPNTLSPELARNSTGLTIDAWIHPRSGSSNDAVRMIVCKGLLAHNTVHANGDDHLAPGYALYLHSGGRLGFQMPGEDYQPVRIEPVLNPMTMDTWHHVAVALAPEPNGGGLFVDGVRVHTFTPPSGIIGNLADLYVGRFPPQLGPQITPYAFNGDIDEVEMFTVQVPDDDILAIYAAFCSGKRRELAVVASPATVRMNTAQAEVCGSIANFAAAPANYAWTLQTLPAGAGCPDAVPVTFTPNAGNLSVGTGDFGTVTATVTIDQPLFGSFQACYRLTVTNLADGATFTSDGVLAYHASPVTGKASCTPPTIGLAAGLTSAVGTRAASPARRTGERLTITPGEATFTVTNDSTDAILLSYEITTRDADTGGASALIALDGLPPGTPATGSVLVPALGSADVPVAVSLPEHEPFLRDQVLLRADLDGDLVNETLAASYVRSAEDTSLVLLGVEPGAGGLRRPTIGPNPFRATAKIRFALPGSRAVEIGVYDVLGRRVRALRSGTLPAGEHSVSWDGRRDDGARVAGGLYFVRVVTAGERWTLKVVAVR